MSTEVSFLSSHTLHPMIAESLHIAIIRNLYYLAGQLTAQSKQHCEPAQLSQHQRQVWQTCHKTCLHLFRSWLSWHGDQHRLNRTGLTLTPAGTSKVSPGNGGGGGGGERIVWRWGGGDRGQEGGKGRVGPRRGLAVVSTVS